MLHPYILADTLIWKKLTSRKREESRREVLEIREELHASNLPRNTLAQLQIGHIFLSKFNLYVNKFAFADTHINAKNHSKNCLEYLKKGDEVGKLSAYLKAMKPLAAFSVQSSSIYDSAGIFMRGYGK